MGLFERFSRKKSLPPLAQAVAETSAVIFGHSVGVVRGIIRHEALPGLGSDPEYFSKRTWAVVFELVVMCMHLADRIAFAELGPERRSRFMDRLVATISHHLADSIFANKSDEIKESFRQDFLQLYGKRQEFYATLALAPAAQDAPLKGTLFWEAAKLTADTYFPDDAGSATLALMVVFGQCPNAVKDVEARLAQVTDWGGFLWPWGLRR